MSLFPLWGNAPIKICPPPAPKLEITTGEAPIRVHYDNEEIGKIHKEAGIYVFYMFPIRHNSYLSEFHFYGNYNSELLRGILAKLDELNGVST